MKSEDNKKDASFLLKKSSFALGLKLLGMIAQYILIFTIAKLYGPKEQGTFTIAYTILQLFAILSQMGLDNRLTRIIASNNESGNDQIISLNYNQSLKATIISSLSWSLLLWFTAPFVSEHIFNKPNLVTSLQWISIAFVPFVLIGLNSAAWRGFKNMTGFLIFKSLLPLIASLLMYLSYKGGLQYLAVFSFSISTIIVAIISIVIWIIAGKIKRSNTNQTLSIKTMLHESMPMMLTGSVFFILGWTDNLILGIFKSEVEVGQYDMAFKLSTLSAVVLLAINAIQAPVFAELHKKGEMQRLQQFIFRSTRILFITSFPVTLILCFFPSFILGWINAEFIPAYQALIILAIGNFFNSITGSIGILLQMTGHQKQYNKIIMIAAISSIIINCILIPQFGILGAAITSAGIKIYQNLAAVRYAKKNLGILSLYFPGVEALFSVRNNKQS